MPKNKWMRAVSKRMEQKGTKGALHEELGISQDKEIPTSRLRSEAAKLAKKGAGDKTLSADELRRSQRIQFALRARSK